MSGAKVSSRIRGDTFRDSVFCLLRMLPGLRRIEREYPIDHQAIDIYYEEATSFGVVPVACECKDYSRPLTRLQLESSIWPKYGPLLQAGKLRALRVITRRAVGVDAQRYADSVGFTITTLDELEAGILDFRGYIQSLRAQFSEGGLNHYYIPVRFESGEDAEDKLRAWLRKERCQPVAIMASYGMGKSSLARRMACLLALDHLQDNRARIPILIPLQDISTEQDIRGLIARQFAALNIVQNFHYDLFCELNRRGRFVLILDGFDEMKHTMSFSDISFNFGEINRLVEGRAKLMLLGRPTAFKDVHERQYALRGLQRNQRRVPEAPEYIELYLKELEPVQAFELMRAYGHYARTRSAEMRNESVSEAVLKARLGHIQQDPELSRLSQRPVQAKMLVDLALNPRVEWRTFSRFELYDEFTEALLTRETLKRTRRQFSIIDRERFQRALAWWMWITDHAGGFEARALPREIFDKHLERAEDIDGVVRDLLVGSLLDSKSNDRYYFRHRSYLEFLVAKHIVNMEWLPGTAELVARVLTPEIVAFLAECPAESDMTFRRWLHKAKGSLTPLFLDVIALADRSAMREIALSPDAHERDVYLFWRALRLNGGGNVDVVRRLLLERLRLKRSESARACIVSAMIQMAPSLYESQRPIDMTRVMVAHILAALLVDAESVMLRLLSAQVRRVSHIDITYPSMRMLVPALSRVEKGGATKVRIDVTALVQAMEQSMPDSDLMNEVVRLPLSYPIDLQEVADVASTQIGNQTIAETARRFVESFEMSLLQMQLRRLSGGRQRERTRS